MNYYYLVATLPELSFDTPPDMSQEEFLTLCGEHLSARDYKVMKELLESTPDKKAGSGFAKAWQEKETQLRNEIVKIRAAKQQKDAEPFLKETKTIETAASKAAEEAFLKKSPLDRELALDHFRWQQIEELAGLDPFTTKAVLAYGLKFKLAKRWADMGREQGEKTAEELLNKKPGEDEPAENIKTHTE
jgi:hypothetical protein